MLVVARRDVPAIRKDPKLEQSTVRSRIMIELTMRDARPGAHDLHLVRMYDSGIAHAVPMLQLSFKDDRDDLHIIMRMCAEAHAAGNGIIIKDAQRAKMHLPRIMPARKAE